MTLAQVWKEICDEDSGNRCCTDAGAGMVDAGASPVNHQYWINRRQGRQDQKYLYLLIDLFQHLGANTISTAGWKSLVPSWLSSSRGEKTTA